MWQIRQELQHSASFREGHTDGEYFQMHLPLRHRGPCVSGKDDICLLPGAQKSTRDNSDLDRQYCLQLKIRHAHPHSIWYSTNPKISLDTDFKSSRQLTSMTTEDLLIHNGCNRQAVKTICEGLPQLNVKSPLAYKNSMQHQEEKAIFLKSFCNTYHYLTKNVSTLSSQGFISVSLSFQSHSTAFQ